MEGPPCIPPTAAHLQVAPHCLYEPFCDEDVRCEGFVMIHNRAALKQTKLSAALRGVCVRMRCVRCTP